MSQKLMAIINKIVEASAKLETLGPGYTPENRHEKNKLNAIITSNQKTLRELRARTWENADDKGRWLVFDTSHNTYAIAVRALQTYEVQVHYSDGDTSLFQLPALKDSRIVFVKNITEPFLGLIKTAVSSA